MPHKKTEFPNVPKAIRARMARIRKTDTQPEMLVRRCVHHIASGFTVETYPARLILCYPRGDRSS